MHVTAKDLERVLYLEYNSIGPTIRLADQPMACTALACRVRRAAKRYEIELLSLRTLTSCHYTM